ncbi:MAG: AAA family ATPase [Thermoproteota archaeon]|nr:AAA family ATPase [Thermoproteota archaeon]
MGKCISFHSYKGGTGKTTLAVNFSTLLASRGYKVFLLDLDFYAPSLFSYFDFDPKYWINDYLVNNADIDNIMVDMKELLPVKMKGDLFVAFSKGGKEDIYQLEGNLANDRDRQLTQFRNFISMREDLLLNRNADFIVMDTSPGIRYWSINSIVISDIILLTLKMGDLDLKGTIKMVQDIYGSLIEYGSVCKLLLNRVAGYCTPPALKDTKNLTFNVVADDSSFKSKINDAINNTIDQSFEVSTITDIPCYCDIQFKEREYLTALEYPAHPFTQKINDLADKISNYL